MTDLPHERVVTGSERDKFLLLRARAGEGAADPRVIDLAYRLTARCRQSHDTQARALHAWVRDTIAYLDERPERFQAAWYTASNGRGDCDCQTILLGAMAEALGLRVEYCAWMGPGRVLTHVCARIERMV